MQKWSDIIFVLDQSGSMGSMWDEAIRGFNDFLSSQKASPVPSRLTLVQFNHTINNMYHGIPLEEVLEMNRETYVPTGCTALFDAVGQTIVLTQHRHEKLSAEQKPETVIFCILTDGMENSSTEYNLSQINKLIEKQTKEQGWEFVFLAVGLEAYTGSQQMGFSPNNKVMFSSRADCVSLAFSKLNEEVLMRKKDSKK